MFKLDLMAASSPLSRAEFNDATYLAGNSIFIHENAMSLSPEQKTEMQALEAVGKTVLFIGKDSELVGAIAVRDTIGAGTREAIQQFKGMGLHVALLSGDNIRTASAIGNEIGVDDVKAGLMPQEKAAEIKKAQSTGRNVAMVGDGINDAPALAVADIGIAVGTGTDIALESADIVVMRSSLQDVATAMHLSRATIRNIRQNLFWAFLYNILAIPIAAGCFYSSLGISLNPMIAAAAMSLSSICVVANALRLAKIKLGN